MKRLPVRALLVILFWCSLAPVHPASGSSLAEPTATGAGAGASITPEPPAPVATSSQDAALSEKTYIGDVQVNPPDLSNFSIQFQDIFPLTPLSPDSTLVSSLKRSAMLASARRTIIVLAIALGLSMVANIYQLVDRFRKKKRTRKKKWKRKRRFASSPLPEGPQASGGPPL